MMNVGARDRAQFVTLAIRAGSHSQRARAGRVSCSGSFLFLLTLAGLRGLWTGDGAADRDRPHRNYAHDGYPQRHGTRVAYVKESCRCPDCTAANTARALRCADAPRQGPAPRGRRAVADRGPVLPGTSPQACASTPSSATVARPCKPVPASANAGRQCRCGQGLSRAPLPGSRAKVAAGGLQHLRRSAAT
jgi:hypothetical protein